MSRDTPAFPGVDPFAVTLIGESAGKALQRLNRPCLVCTEYVFPEQGKEFPIDLRNCEIFGGPRLPDLIRISDGQYAIGAWNPSERRYDHPIRKVERGDVISWCRAGGYIYPPEFMPVPRTEPKATTGPAQQDAPPVICSQGAVARWQGKSPNTARFLQSLKEAGVILGFELVKRGQYKMWFADPITHERALRDISAGPKPRKA